MAYTEADLQLVVNKFVEALRLFGLAISRGKTEVLLQPAPGFSPRSPYIDESERNRGRQRTT